MTNVTLAQALSNIEAIDKTIIGDLSTKIEFDENVSVVYTHLQPRASGSFSIYDLILLSDRPGIALSDREVIACTEIKYPEENSSHTILKREILAWVVFMATGSYSRQGAEPSMINSKTSYRSWLVSEAFNRKEQYQIVNQGKQITIDNETHKFIALATDLISENLLSFDQLKSFINLFMMANKNYISSNFLDTPFFTAFEQIFKKAFVQGFFDTNQNFDVALCLGAILSSIKTDPSESDSARRKPLVLTTDQEDQILSLLQHFFKQPAFSAKLFSTVCFSPDDYIDVPVDYLILCLNNFLSTLRSGIFNFQMFQHLKELDSEFCVDISFFNNHFMKDIELKKVPVDVHPVDGRVLPFIRFFYEYDDEFKDSFMQDMSQPGTQTPLASFLEKMGAPVEQHRKMLTLFTNLTEDLETFDGEFNKDLPIRSEIIQNGRYNLDVVCREFKRFLTATEKAYLAFIQSRTVLRKNPEFKKFLLDLKPLFWLEININSPATYTSLKGYIDASIHLFKLQMRRFFDDSFLRTLTQFPFEQIKSIFGLFEEGRGFIVEPALQKLQLIITLKIGVITDSVDIPKSSVTAIDEMINISMHYQNCLRYSYAHLRLDPLTQISFNTLGLLEYVKDCTSALKKLIEMESAIDHELIPIILEELMTHADNIVFSYLGYNTMTILLPNAFYYNIHKTLLHYAFAIERGIITTEQYCKILEKHIQNEFNNTATSTDFNEDLTDLILKIIGRYLSYGKVDNLEKLINKA
ncbi:MAG: hypothetical protein KBE16_03635 [Alphaproteobacteria bacterium]|jgi:hypothetical protein|nr:hypothetical protein [Alphaproteobacteria bacterium]MBP9877083.1 hypothetical protein [Alphaproteobacteria bacterium]